jgi:hypothetical protein
MFLRETPIDRSYVLYGDYDFGIEKFDHSTRFDLHVCRNMIR